MTDPKRDAKIFELHRYGLSQQLIAERFGLHQKAVSGIIKRMREVK